MFEGSNLLLDYFLIGIGSLLGASLRLQLLEYSFRPLTSKLNRVLYLNILATFLLGFVLSSKEKLLLTTIGNSLFLSISVGFLGSFSTFSSFVFELYYFFKKNYFKQGITFIIYALFSSFIATSGSYPARD